MKDNLCQKNTWQYDIFYKYSEKMVSPKTITLEHDLSCCVIWKDDKSFSLDGKSKMKFSKEIHGNIIFPSNAQKI